MTERIEATIKVINEDTGVEVENDNFTIDMATVLKGAEKTGWATEIPNPTLVADAEAKQKAMQAAQTTLQANPESVEYKNDLAIKTAEFNIARAILQNTPPIPNTKGPGVHCKDMLGVMIKRNFLIDEEKIRQEKLAAKQAEAEAEAQAAIDAANAAADAALGISS